MLVWVAFFVIDVYVGLVLCSPSYLLFGLSFFMRCGEFSGGYFLAQRTTERLHPSDRGGYEEGAHLFSLAEQLGGVR